MSKIGRKSIPLANVTVEVKGQEVHYKGKKASGVYHLPKSLQAQVENKELKLIPNLKEHDINRVWGLHRALLANQIKGADTGFEKQLRINGLGFKAAVSGSKLVLSLGFSHKIDYELPKSVTVAIDKTGQLMNFSSSDKELLGQVCSDIRSFRPPEPYKGTGIQYATETIRRKAGKAKAA